VRTVTTSRSARLLIAAAVTALALPALARAGFSSQLVPISEPAPAGNTGVTDVAAGPSGDVLVAWSESRAETHIAVRLRRIRPDGSLGPVLDITDGTTRAGNPHVAVGPNGRAIVAWVEAPSFGQPSAVRARWVEPDDTLGEPITLKTAGAASDSGELELTATATNGALVAWHNFTSVPGPFRRIEARYVTATGDVSDLIFPVSGGGSTGVVAAGNASGGALLSWRDSGVEAQEIASDGTPGLLQTPAPGLVADPGLATDGNDHFQLIYKRGSLPAALEYRALAANGSFGPEQDLDPSAQEQIGSFDVATDSDNRSLVVWNRFQPNSDQVVRARFLAPSGAPEPDTFATSAGIGNLAEPDAGIGGDGGAIAWVTTTVAGSESVWGRILPASGPPQDPIPLSSQTGDPSRPLLEIAPDNVGLAAWTEGLDPEGPEPQRQILARQILPPPRCPDVHGTVVQGRPTRIDLACTGLQLEAPEIVGRPAHGTLGVPDVASQGVTYTPRPGYAGADGFTFRGLNRGGAGTIQTATLTVGRDTVRPVIRRFGISRRRVRVAVAAATAKRGRRTVFRLRYSEIATATIRIELRRRCPRNSHRRRVRCKKYRRIGSLRARTARISTTVPLRMRFGGRQLRPGRYRASAVARDRAGNLSKLRRLGFRVIGP
jgi:hypothetical protein